MNGGAPPFNSACGELSVLRGVGSSQDFPRGGRQQATSVNTVLLEAGSMDQLKDLSSCHCYPCSPGISSKWIWPLAKQPVHTSLIRVFLCAERMEAGVEVEGERLAPSLPKRRERAAENPAGRVALRGSSSPAWWGAGLCTSGVLHQQRLLTGREKNATDAVLHPACICLWNAKEI